ncbi:MAG: iron-containing alcohol dehydrogenase [Bacillota bacterium]|nr:iron-containing alcohol dehydrogenase [Bacillota bacterium]
MIKPFEFLLPTKIIFGSGELKTLKKVLKDKNPKKIMVVTDPNLRNLAIFEKLLEQLENYEYVVFDEIEPNPKDYNVEKGAKFAVDEEVDLIIAFGGGSPIDATKVISLIAAQGGSVKEYIQKKVKIEKALPFIAIPTTAGTGSEVTFSSVITDTEEKFKYTIKSPLIAADVAIIDPELTLSLPRSITATTGMDALTHAIEGYTALCTEPVAESLGLTAVSYITRNLEEAVENGDNINARENVMMGSLLAGLSFSHSDVAAVHCMAEALGSIYDSPHGTCNSVLLPYVMEYNLPEIIDKYASISREMGIEGEDNLEVAKKGIEKIKELSKEIGLPDFKSLNIDPNDFEKLSEMSEKNGSTPSNPRAINKEQYLEIFKKAYKD